ncbi:MAG: PKD domain-containing protein, partial [Bacteroidetes bacterium]|nr:PKD domain-containing protein [Bacteroidota bacterium]
MKKSIRFILLVLAALPVMLFAQKFAYENAWGKAGFNLQDSKANGVEVVFSVPEFSIETAQINGENMQSIVFPTFFLFNDAGAPNLPAGGRYIAIPQGAIPKLRITDSRISVIENVNVAPAPVIPLETDDSPMKYEKNAAIYNLNAFYPAQPVILSSIENIRGCDVVMLGISPFQYNPVTKQLKVYHDLKIAIDFEGGNGQFGDVAYRSRWWDPTLSDALLNYASLPVVDYNARMQQVTEGSDECEYIIISPSGPDFMRWADSIKIFRNEQGVLTKVFDVSTIGGNTTTAIESFLNNAYNTWTLKPAACLLLGDYGTDGLKNIISPIYDGYCASDNIYGDVTGDMMPDIVMARFTANNDAQLTTMLSKFLSYERNPPTDTFFYNHPVTALGWQTERWFQICSETIGGFFKHELGKDPDRENAIYQGNPNSDPWSTATNTNTILGVFGPNGLGYIPATPQELGGWSGGTATGINTAINTGAFLVQHRDHGYETGWGEPAYSNSNINSLTNSNLTFVMSINCLTGKYNWSGECFVEKFHRHTKNGLNAGAVGLIGASETSYSFVNDTYVWGVYDNMWTNFMPAYGTTPESRGCLPAFGNAAGKYFLKQSNWPYNTGNKAVTYNLFHAHGDAFMPLYWEMPVALNVTHAAQLMAGATTFTVTANPGAFVALTVNNNIIGTGLVGLGGSIDITIPAQTVGSLMVVTVTKQNYFRYRAEVPVITESLTAEFAASQTLLCQGASINFTDQSYGNPVSWSWSFEGGNPSTSTDQNPQGITYATPGSYNVSLTITDASSNQNTVNKPAYINAYDYPVAMFGVDGVCEGSATNFTDESTGMSISMWNWDFGDGNTSTLQNPAHTYAAAGSYNVTLTVNNIASCEHIYSASVDILS